MSEENVTQEVQSQPSPQPESAPAATPAPAPEPEPFADIENPIDRAAAKAAYEQAKNLSPKDLAALYLARTYGVDAPVEPETKAEVKPESEQSKSEPSEESKQLSARVAAIEAAERGKAIEAKLMSDLAKNEVFGDADAVVHKELINEFALAVRSRGGLPKGVDVSEAFSKFVDHKAEILAPAFTKKTKKEWLEQKIADRAKTKTEGGSRNGNGRLTQVNEIDPATFNPNELRKQLLAEYRK